jgi:hypothetical protein
MNRARKPGNHAPGIRALMGRKLRATRGNVASIRATPVRIRQALVADAFFLTDH